jgi:polysaccharide export outer membrane protein
VVVLLPATAGAGEYRIAPGDVLAVSVWDQKDLDQVVTVRPDGKISLPLVGEVEAGGLTAGDLASRLSTQYSRTVRGAHVIVSLREIHSRPVSFRNIRIIPPPRPACGPENPSSRSASLVTVPLTLCADR